jgi:hypothetical protein
MTETPNGPLCKQEHELAAQKTTASFPASPTLRKKLKGHRRGRPSPGERLSFPRGRLLRPRAGTADGIDHV